jgi:hypothetical protein
MDYEEHEARKAAGIVKCDDGCPAKLDPTTLEEYRAAVEHWRHHHLYSGCSHGR